MNSIIKKIIFLSLLCFIPFSIQAKSELILETTEECNIQYAGDSCIVDLNFINNTGKILDGTAIFSVDKDPIGIYPFFGLSSEQTEWNNGHIIFSGFKIPKGKTAANLEIKTHPALNPGSYTFTFSIEGTFEEEEISGNSGAVQIPVPFTIGIEEATSTPQMTIEELKTKIKEIQMRIIILLYKIIIQFLSQLILL